MATIIAAAKVPLVIEQGAEFRNPLWWAQPTRRYSKISGITADAPARISTNSAHGMPQGWPFWVESVKGMEEIIRPFPTEENPKSPGYTCTLVDPSTVEINDLNALGFTPYGGSGVIIYQPPYDFTGATARMQIRKNLTDSLVLKELTTENGGIILDNTLGVIILFISDVDTAALTWKTGVYDLEVKLNGAGAERVAYGAVTVSPEVTR